MAAVLEAMVENLTLLHSELAAAVAYSGMVVMLAPFLEEAAVAF